MDDNLIYFTPDIGKSTRQNINAFTEFSKQLTELNTDIVFEDNYWKKEVNFVKIGISSKDRNSNNLLDESIRDFTKAYVKYQRINSKLKTQDTIIPLRLIEEVCLVKYGLVDLIQLTIADFDLAAELARKTYKGSAYSAGRHLKILLDFLRNIKVLDLPDWKNPNKKPVDKVIVLDKESEEYRASKLPDEDGLFALAEIFSRKESELSDRDIFVTSSVSLLLSAPERASELFFLKDNCIHEEDVAISHNNALASTAPDKKQVLGLRWYAQKNFGYDIKYIPSVMISIVRLAIERLKKMSEKPRRFAYLLENSDKFPRHELCPQVSDEQLLTKKQTLQALGFDESNYTNAKTANNSGNQFLVVRGLERKDNIYSLNDLNKLIRSRLPEGFPYVPFEVGNGIKIKWSEALFCFFANQLHTQKPTVITELWMPIIDTLNEDLSPTKKKLKGRDEFSNTKSIFHRWEYGDYSVSSHQFRHLLNTIANTNGMDSVLLAKWSGRADIKQNRIYDHTTAEARNYALVEMQKNEIAITEDNRGYNFQIATPRTLQELNTRTSLAMHVTEFGVCTHSYIDEPCLKYRNCLNCTEHVCIKGDQEKTKRLQGRLKKEKILWQKDKLAVANNVTGANVWLETRELTIQRCEQMLALLNDPHIEDGTPLSLPFSEAVSHLDLAYQKVGRKRIPLIENTQRKISKDKFIETDSIIADLWV